MLWRYPNRLDQGFPSYGGEKTDCCTGHCGMVLSRSLLSYTADVDQEQFLRLRSKEHARIPAAFASRYQ